MLVRPIADAERPAAAELFAVAFESPLDRSALPAPEWNRPQIWAAFSDAGEMMSTIYITDFAVQFDGTVCKTGGIGGVASLPQHRRSGGIRACFQQALPQMYRDGYVFSYLFPFSTVYYRKFGYESCVQRYRTVVHLPQLPPLKDAGTLRLASPAAPLLDEVRALDAQWEAYYNMSVQHTAADYDWLLRCDPAAKQEFTYVWFDASGTPKAYTTFRLALEPDGRNLVCSRFCFSSPEGYRGLMTLFSRLAADHQYVKFRIPAEPAIQYLMPEWFLGAVCWELEPAGMVRVINAAEALRRARYRGSGTVCTTRRFRKTMAAFPSALNMTVLSVSRAQTHSRMPSWKSARFPPCCAASAALTWQSGSSPHCVYSATTAVWSRFSLKSR